MYRKQRICIVCGTAVFASTLVVGDLIVGQLIDG
jgi:hypothetical protein